jgi:hypothetical protein
MVKVAAGFFDRDVVDRQPDVGVGAAVILLDVGLEVVGVGDRPKTWCQRGEGSDCHVVAIVADLGHVVVPRRGHDLGSGPPVWVGYRTLGVVVVFLVLGMSPVLDVMTLVLLALHDPVDAAQRTVLTVVVEAVPEFLLLALAVTLIDVAAGVAIAPVFVEVSTLVDGYRGFRSRLVDLLPDRGEPAMRRPIRSAVRVPARRRCS